MDFQGVSGSLRLLHLLTAGYRRPEFLRVWNLQLQIVARHAIVALVEVCELMGGDVVIFSSLATC